MIHFYCKSWCLFLIIAFLFSSCYCLQTWGPDYLTKQEWREHPGQIDTNDRVVDIECTHLLFIDKLIYHKSNIIHIYYHLGDVDSNEDVDETIRKIILIKLFTDTDTLKYDGKQIDNQYREIVNAKINFSYTGIKNIKRLNLLIRYTRFAPKKYSLYYSGDKIDTISELIKLRRHTFLKFFPIIRND